MAHYILDKAYAIDEPEGVEAHRVVVQGDRAGAARLPAAANADAILGVTVFAQPRAGAAVAVRKAGIARVAAAGAIDPGEPVNVAPGGKVKRIDEAPGTKVRCVGFAETGAAADGDLIDVFIALHERTA